MRIQNANVIGNFLLRKKAHSPKRNFMWGGYGSTISTDGEKLYSYSTPIAEWRGDVVAINGEKYSMTTTMQQSDLRRMCELLKVKTEET